MKKTSVVSLVLLAGVLLSACLPVTATPTEAAEPPPDLQSTAIAMAEMIALQTLESLPTPTAIPPTETPTPEPLVVLSTNTPDLLAALPTLSTVTGTPPPKSDGAPWTCDIIPDFVDRGILVIRNDTHKSIYISLFGVSRPHEYHVCYGLTLRHSTTLDVPLGSYTYVVVVGGAKFRGTFDYKTINKVEMTVYKDRVAIH